MVRHTAPAPAGHLPPRSEAAGRIALVRGARRAGLAGPDCPLSLGRCQAIWGGGGDLDCVEEVCEAGRAEALLGARQVGAPRADGGKLVVSDTKHHRGRRVASARAAVQLAHEAVAVVESPQAVVCELRAVWQLEARSDLALAEEMVHVPRLAGALGLHRRRLGIAMQGSGGCKGTIMWHVSVPLCPCVCARVRICARAGGRAADLLPPY